MTTSESGKEPLTDAERIPAGRGAGSGVAGWQWARGFMRGVALRSRSWAPIFTDENEGQLLAIPLDGGRLELLAKLLENYEKDRFIFKKRDPIDATVFRMEERG
jgi:hypothetical protein